MLVLCIESEYGNCQYTLIIRFMKLKIYIFDKKYY